MKWKTAKQLLEHFDPNHIAPVSVNTSETDRKVFPQQLFIPSSFPF